MAVTENLPDAAQTNTQTQIDAEPQAASVLPQRLLQAAIPIGTAIALILIWQFGVRFFEVPTYIAPAPSDVGDVNCH